MKSANISPPRESTTIAIRWAFPREVRPSWANFSSIWGGTLSTQKYPRSSRALMTLDFPAPERPVTIISSILLHSFADT